MNNSSFKSDISSFLESVTESVNTKLHVHGKVLGREVNEALGGNIVPDNYIWESKEYKNVKELFMKEYDISHLTTFDLEALKDVCEEELFRRMLDGRSL